MKLFDINGPLMDAMRKLSDIVIYNLLFCIFSLPFFTVGASLCALCEGMQLIASEKDSDLSVFKTFFNTFKKNFSKGILLWLLCIFGSLIIYSMRYASTLKLGAALNGSYMITYYVVMLLFVFVYQNLFPTMAYWQELKAFGCIRRSFELAIIGFPWTVLGIVTASLFGFVTLAMNRGAMLLGMFVWAVCGFGVVAYISSFFFLKAAANYEKRRMSG